MRILSIELDNVRSHESTRIDFNNGISVISGRTGSGKSSILMGVEYCLFGAGASMNKSSLLRRGQKRGKITLRISHMGNEYTITRGFVRSGSSIIADQHAGSVKKNGKELLKMSRESDITENVMKILGYPNESKAKNLFETTTYTKQDEIRKLINLTKTERREYIDGVLNLSKYKWVWDNSIELIREIKRVSAGLEGEVKSEEMLEQEIRNVEERMLGSQKEIGRISLEMERLEGKISGFEKEFKIMEEELSRMEKESVAFESSQRIVKMKQDEAKRLEQELSELSERVAQMKRGIGSPLDYESCLKDFEETKQRISSEQTRFQETRKEYSEILSLEGGECPLCKQRIDPAHKTRIRSDFEAKKSASEERIRELKQELEKREKTLEKAKEQKEASDRIRQMEAREKDIGNSIEEANRVIEKNIASIREFDREEYDSRKKGHEKMLEERTSLLSSMNALKSTLRVMEQQEKESREDFERLGAELEKMKLVRERISLMEKMQKFFSKAREDIRSIGDVARARFIRDFRKEFQSRFEEIRRWEQEYSVNIKGDYEPFAYTEGTKEIPVSDLSGGEKTSVALAYRLALSDIASRLGGISRSQTLILDEPTIGFDREDIKVLPEVLKNIKNIPQIIIVTHESELKEAADYQYVVEKKSGTSIIQ